VVQDVLVDLLAYLAAPLRAFVAALHVLVHVLDLRAVVLVAAWAARGVGDEVQ